VPAVRDLDRLRRTIGNAANILRPAVTRHQFHAGVGLQPVRHAGRRTVGEQIDRPMLRQIHNDGAIHAAFAQRPIVQANLTWWRGGRDGYLPHRADQRGGAGREVQGLGEPGAGFSTQRQGERLERLTAPSSLLRPRWEEGQPFREGRARATGIQTAKAAHMQAQLDGVAADRQIARRADVVAMYPNRRDATGRTDSAHRGRGGGDGKDGCLQPRVTDGETGPELLKEEKRCQMKVALSSWIKDLETYSIPQRVSICSSTEVSGEPISLDRSLSRNAVQRGR